MIHMTTTKQSITVSAIIITLMVLLMMPADLSAQKKCPKCLGKGIIQTHFATSNFGLDNRKIKCKYCGEWFSAALSHWDACTKCNGTGSVNGRGSSEHDDDICAFNYKSYLTQDELMAVANIEQQLVTPVYEYTKCSVCDGTGICTHCNGTGGYYTIGSYEGHCFVCGGSGQCVTCKGSGTSYTIISAPDTDNLLEQLSVYVKRASQRANKNGQW